MRKKKYTLRAHQCIISGIISNADARLINTLSRKIFLFIDMCGSCIISIKLPHHSMQRCRTLYLHNKTEDQDQPGKDSKICHTDCRAHLRLEQPSCENIMLVKTSWWIITLPIGLLMTVWENIAIINISHDIHSRTFIFIRLHMYMLL